MIGSLYSGLSGIQNHQKQLEVIGNNIANVNTIGFKSGRVLFSDTISQTLQAGRFGGEGTGGTDPQQIGTGVQVKTIDNILTQGGLQETDVRTDLALDGRGFFMLSDGITRYYTRAGTFDIDEQGFLVDSGTGMIVQGRTANNKGVIETGTSIEDIQLNFGDKIPAKATTKVELVSNLDAEGVAEDTKGVKADTAFTITKADTAFTKNDGADAASGTDDINGLDQVTTDLSAGDTITISGTDSEGNEVTATYTYADNDTLNALITAINDAFTAAGAGDSVSINSEGYFELDPASTTQTPQLTLGFTNSNPDDDSSSIELPEITVQVADENTLINILNQVGKDLDTNDKITISGTNSEGTDITSTYTYTADDTLQDLMTEIEDAFIHADGTTKPTATIDENGYLKLTPPEGAEQDISLSLTPNTDVGTDAVGTDAKITLPQFDAPEGYQYDTSFVAYDSEGYKHTVTVIFEKTNENEWNWEADVSTPSATVGTGTNSGTITFNSDGSLKNFTFTNEDATSFQFDPGNGAGLVSIDLNVGTIGEFDGITQFASKSNVAARSQDGYQMGMLQDFDIDEQGVITGIFTNGLSRTLAQLTVANFNNPSGLVKKGDSYYQPSPNSGQAVLGEAGTSGLGYIRSGTLELSNVDLANEFTNLVIAQRGFQANSNVITTTDTLFNDLMRLKRA